MTGRSRAKREARGAAARAEAAEQQLAQQTQVTEQRRERESRRAQRLLFRSIRAAGGGFFETDQSQTLGTSGVLG